MEFVEVHDLRKVFGKKGTTELAAVQDVSFEIRKGKIFTLLGPSGCGKTTTIRCLAGLEEADSGEITIDGVSHFSSSRGIFIPPEKRNLGMVFQSYALWPHMNVYDNIAYPLTVRKVPGEDIKNKVSRIIETVALQGKERSPVTQLSGGQQQRVALARALVHEPELLLLDEPLSNLDAKLREQMRLELKELQRRLNITTVYVTHDQQEALALSDEIAVMSEGRILQRGSPEEIYKNPSKTFVADFVGLTNFIEGKVLSLEVGGSVKVATGVGEIRAIPKGDLSVNESVLVAVRPEDISVYQPGETPTGEKLLEGKIVVVSFTGELLDCKAKVNDVSIRVRVPSSSKLREGSVVFLRFQSNRCSALPKSS